MGMELSLSPLRTGIKCSGHCHCKIALHAISTVQFLDERYSGHCSRSVSLPSRLLRGTPSGWACLRLSRRGRRSSRQKKKKPSKIVNYGATEPIVILGFGERGQVLAKILSAPLSFGLDQDSEGWPYVAFDLNPAGVKSARKSGFPVLYGNGSRPAVLQSAGITFPKATMVMYTGKEKTNEAVNRLRQAFTAVPIYAKAQDLSHLLDLKKAGATDVVLENAETSLQLGSILLRGLGVMFDDVSFLSKLVRNSMEVQAQEALKGTGDKEVDMMKPLLVWCTSRASVILLWKFCVYICKQERSALPFSDSVSVFTVHHHQS